MSNLQTALGRAAVPNNMSRPAAISVGLRVTSQL